MATYRLKLYTRLNIPGQKSFYDINFKNRKDKKKKKVRQKGLVYNQENNLTRPPLKPIREGQSLYQQKALSEQEDQNNENHFGRNVALLGGATALGTGAAALYHNSQINNYREGFHNYLDKLSDEDLRNKHTTLTSGKSKTWYTETRKEALDRIKRNNTIGFFKGRGQGFGKNSLAGYNRTEAGEALRQKARTSARIGMGVAALGTLGTIGYGLFGDRGNNNR